MGTTLTGTTPQDTYDSLIKVTDNGPISATAKYLSDGLGNDSALALSTSMVGIGTAAPSLQGFNNELTISSGISGTKRTALNLQGSRTTPSTFASIGFYHQANLVASLESSRGDADNSASLEFFTSNAGTTGERMRITADGNVGIGTSAADSKLNIQLATSTTALQAADAGLLISTSEVSTSNTTHKASPYLELRGGIWNGTASTARGWTLQDVGISGTNYGHRLAIGSDDNPNLMSLTSTASGGNVGIGTSAPANRLVVKAGGYGAIASLLDTSDNGFVFKADGFLGFNAIDQTQQLIMNFSGSEKYRFNTDGRLEVGSGIVFPSTQVASANANTLDDYEEGTWTMGVSFNGASVGVTYTSSTGSYTKIGRQVTVNGYLQLSNKGSSTGAAKVTGLPFTIKNSESAFSSPSLSFSNISFANQFQGICAIADTVISLEEMTELGVAGSITNADFANNSYIVLSFTYFV